MLTCNVNMSAEILITLSKQIDAAIPQLMMLAAGRKITHGLLCLALKACSMSSVWNCKPVQSLRDCYDTVELRFSYAWATCYMMLIAYVLYDSITNANDFINCKEHNVPRPIGIFCAVALTCFVFTTKLSTSVMSVVVMLCAKQMNILTGLACVVNFAIWADLRGTSLTLLAASMLAGVHFFFCRLSSSAGLCTAGMVWCAVWAWLGVLNSLVSSAKGVATVKKET